MPNKIVIFTLNGCDHCVSLKNRLNDSGISFDEIETTENESLWNKIVEQIKHDILPTTLIINSEKNTSKVFVPGVHYKTENEIVNIIKSSI